MKDVPIEDLSFGQSPGNVQFPSIVDEDVGPFEPCDVGKIQKENGY
jgi:hypothetical protein